MTWKRTQNRQFQLESLEARLAPATFMVTDVRDDVTIAGTLRWAIELSNGVEDDEPNTIEIDASLSGETIRLAQGPLPVERYVTIEGPSQQPVIIDAGGTSRLFHASASLFLSDLVLSNGSSHSHGGAIYGKRSHDSPYSGISVGLESVSITGSSAAGNGGAVYSDGRLTFRNSSLADNFSGGDGGAAFSLDDISSFQSSIHDNVAAGEGGGLHAASSVKLRGSTVSGNTSMGTGGGVVAEQLDGGASTVVNNASSIQGGGVSINSQSGEVDLLSSIISGNLAPLSPDVRLALPEDSINIRASLVGDNRDSPLAEAQQADVNGNLIGSSVGGGVMDPRLEALADNGGPTLTHALRIGSPAIDTGAAIRFDHVDQRGSIRKFGPGVDMGAFELAPIVDGPFTVSTLADEVDGDFSPGDLSLREAMELSGAHAGPHEILFAESLFAEPATIDLALGELLAIQPVSIEGPGHELLTIDAQQRSRIFTSTTSIRIASVTLTGGQATPYLGGYFDPFGGRGGVLSGSGDVQFRDAVVTGNSAESGGAVSVVTGNVSIVRSTFTGNSAHFAGGAVYSFDRLAVEDSTFSHNQASMGGGLSVRYLTMTGSTISSNSASTAGGGLYVLLGLAPIGDVQISSTTVFGNSAGEYGGGIAMPQVPFAFTEPKAFWTLDHSIAAGNFATQAPDMWHTTHAGSAPEITYCLIGTREGTGLVESQLPDRSGNLVGGITGGAINPELGPLADNGGPTETHLPLAGSPVINAGGPPDTSMVSSFDQRGSGFDRILGGGRDLGAVELRDALGWHNIETPEDVDGDTFVGPLDALLVIRELTDRVFSSIETGSLTFNIDVPLDLDVDNDGVLGPIDALIVIGQLPTTRSDAAEAPAFRVPPPADEDDAEDSPSTFDMLF